MQFRLLSVALCLAATLALLAALPTATASPLAAVTIDATLASSATDAEQISPVMLRRGGRAADAEQVMQAEAEDEMEAESESEEDEAALVEVDMERVKRATKASKGQAKAKKATKAKASKKSSKKSSKQSSKKSPARRSGRKAPKKAGKASKQKKKHALYREPAIPSAPARKPRIARKQNGWAISPNRPRRAQQRLPAARLTGAASTLTRANVRCVLCQFIVQKLKNQLTPEGEAAPASASLIEAFSFASLGEQARVESLVQSEAHAAARASALPSLFESGPDASRRFRHTDVLASRASRARFTQVRAGAGADAAEQRQAYLKLYSTVYASFEGLCASRMPLAYLPYCNDMLKSYRFFAQGVNYGDRPEQICMNGNFCDHRAYVRAVTHNAYQREPGDA